MISVILHQNFCLFGSVKLTKNTDINKYKYSGYGIGFVGDDIGRNVVIFEVVQIKKMIFQFLEKQ